METKELEFEIAKGQMSFALDEMNFDQSLEDGVSIQTEKLLKSQNHEWIKEETLFVVVRAQDKKLSNDLPSLKLCGKKMIEWVRLAGVDCEQVVIDDEEDIFERISQIQTEKQYIAIFYSDTPLLSRGLFYKIMSNFSAKNVNYLRLSRGFIVKREFLLSRPYFMQSAVVGFDSEGLVRADNAKAISQMQKILNERILAFHEANGVIIYGKNTVFIDADVEIEAGVIIEPNNIIQGETVVSGGTILASGNIIKNSIISHNCTISASYIEKSKISQGKEIKPFSKIIEEEI